MSTGDFETGFKRARLAFDKSTIDENSLAYELGKGNEFTKREIFAELCLLFKDQTAIWEKAVREFCYVLKTNTPVVEVVRQETIRLFKGVEKETVKGGIDSVVFSEKLDNVVLEFLRQNPVEPCYFEVTPDFGWKSPSG